MVRIPREFLEEIGIEFDRVATGFAADTCLACKNSNDPSVISCKYEVQSSSPVLNYKFYTYTSDDCSDGKEMKEEQEFEVGQCLTEDYGSVTFTYLEQISSPSELEADKYLWAFNRILQIVRILSSTILLAGTMTCVLTAKISPIWLTTTIRLMTTTLRTFQ